MSDEHLYLGLKLWFKKFSQSFRDYSEDSQSAPIEEQPVPKAGDHFTETWSLKEIVVTSTDRTHVTTVTTVDRNHKVYPLDMFWQLHTRR